MIEIIAKYFSFTTCISQLLLGITVCFYMKFFHITKIPHIVKSLFEPQSCQSVSPFAAVTVALAGTLGVGNIVGVASSIYLGGPGSIFWMWVGAFFSMILKYSEVLLTVKHREKYSDGYIGGAFSYMKPKYIANLFAILCICASFSIGNFLQMNTLSDILLAKLLFPKILTGIIIFIIILFLINNNIRFISQITSYMIPFASITYIIMCLAVITDNLAQIPRVITLILENAFDFKAAVSGTFAFVITKSMRYGITRGLITNEAGCGTAPIAHACADTDSPVRQGFWGLFEVFLDTFVLCTLTALVILCDSSQSYGNDIEYILGRFSYVLGPISDTILTICITIFAIATLIGWSQYGLISLNRLTKSQKSKQAYIFTYALLAIIGCVITSELMWNIADITIGIMTMINSFFLLIKINEIRSETLKYFKPHGMKKRDRRNTF